MNSGFHGIALWLAAIFLALVVAIFFLVKWVFRSRGWREWGMSARPIQVGSRAAARLIGVVIALVGCGYMMWSWSGAQAQRSFSFKMAALGPTFIGVGAWMLIEGPVIPPGRETYPPPSILGWVMIVSGFALGLLYSEFLRTGRLPFAP